MWCSHRLAFKYCLLLLASVGLIVCEIPVNPFEFKFCSYGHIKSDLRWIDWLGHVVKLDTFLSAQSIESFSTTFKIYNRIKKSEAEVDNIVFGPPISTSEEVSTER